MTSFPVFSACLTEAGCSRMQGVKEVTPFQLDVTDPKSVCWCHSFLQCSTCCDLEQIENAYHFVSKVLKKANGTLWGVVNNAGACVRFFTVLKPTTGTVSAGLIEWGPMSFFQRVLAVNLFGTIAVTKLFLPLIRRSFRGCVVLLHFRIIWPHCQHCIHHITSEPAGMCTLWRL